MVMLLLNSLFLYRFSIVRFIVVLIGWVEQVQLCLIVVVFVLFVMVLKILFDRNIVFIGIQFEVSFLVVVIMFGMMFFLIQVKIGLVWLKLVMILLVMNRMLCLWQIVCMVVIQFLGGISMLFEFWIGLIQKVVICLGFSLVILVCNLVIEMLMMVCGLWFIGL